MTDKPDAPQTPRPHATIDVKAREIPDPQAAKPSAAGPSADVKPQDTKPGDAKAAETKSADAKSGPAKPQDAKPAAAAASATAKAASETKPNVDAPRARGGGFFSNLVAGLVGGALVYGGTTYLPEFGIGPPRGDSELVNALSARLKALETAPPSEDKALKAEIEAARERIASLEGLNQTVAELSAAQAKTSDVSKAIDDKVGRSDVEADRARVQKLEDQLRLIAESGASGSSSVPQVAALAGKITDLEQALATNMASLRKTLPQDFETRFAAVLEASEAAKAGAQRVDREVTQIRSEAARLGQRVEGQKADLDRLTAAIEAQREETGRLASAVGDLKGLLETKVAKPQDVSAAVSPVASKVAALEQSLEGVVKSEAERRANAERIVIALELANLKRAIDRGQSYAAELADVKKAGGALIDLSSLEPYKAVGVPTIASLREEFRPLMYAVIEADSAPAEGSFIDQMLSGAKSIVRVRKTTHDAADTSAEAVVSRMDAALEAGQLGGVLELAKTIPQRASAPIQDWLGKVEARQAADGAIKAIETQLKASLTAEDKDAQAVTPAVTPSN